ncbi:MAG: ferric reductase-like transmembrane domain-containing protein [Solirubrobacteraceae bacterium]
MSAAAALGPSAYWYLTRASGVVALILLTAVVVLGVLGAVGVSGGTRWPRFAIGSLHRDVSLLAVALLAIHIVTTVLDGFAPITLIDAVIPFIGAYRPIWLGLGALAFDLVLALVLTSLIRRRLGYHAWRTVHWLAYASWPVAVLHGLGTGSDSNQPWALAITAACVGTVGCAVIARIARGEGLSERGRSAAIGASILTPLGIAVFAVLGPLAPGWAARAGTPEKLVTHTVTRTAPALATGPVTRTAELQLPFDANLSGSVRQSPVPGGAFIDLLMSVSGGASGELRVRLAGEPEGAGLSLTGSQVDLAVRGEPVVLAGTITQLQGESFIARVSAAGHTPLELAVRLEIHNQTGSVTGTISGRATR